MPRSRPTASRVYRFLRAHGLQRGLSQLWRIFRQMHELRLGEFKGVDWRGNEYYFDPQAEYHKQRFVIYRDGRGPQQRTHRAEDAACIPDRLLHHLRGVSLSVCSQEL